MIVNAYPNDVRGVKLPLLCRLFLIRRSDFILIEETSFLLPKLLDPQDSRIPDSDSPHPFNQKHNVLYQVRLQRC